MKEYKKHISKKEINKSLPLEKNAHVIGKISQGHYKNMGQNYEKTIDTFGIGKVTKQFEIIKNNFSVKTQNNHFTGSQEIANEKTLNTKNSKKNAKRKQK